MRLALTGLVSLGLTLGHGLVSAARAQGAVAASATYVQMVDDFSWPLDRGAYRYYSRLAADRGIMGDGLEPHGVTLDAGQLHLVATQGALGTSWAGLWESLAGTVGEAALSLDFQRALPWPIRDPYQARVTSVRLRARGSGVVKIELRRADNQLVRAWSQAVNSAAWTPLEFATTDVIDPIKLLNVVAESPADLWIDDVAMGIEMPAMTPVRYAFVVSLAQLLRAYAPDTGWVRDHAQFPSGDFTSVPGSGEVALAVAAASQLEVVSADDARAVVGKASAVLLSAPRYKGWLPHFLKNSQAHPDSEWSTLDSGLALLSSMQASTMLGMTSLREELRGLVDTLDFAAVTMPNGELSMGFDPNHVILASTWNRWGSELSLVDLVRAYRDPRLAPLPVAPQPGRHPPAYCGRGFVYPMAGLLVPHHAGARPDRWGVVWSQALRDHLAEQLAYVGGSWLFGLSSAEILTDDGDTPYWEGGIGDSVTPCPANPGPGGGHWVAPHYMGMSAALAEPAVAEMVQAGLLPPLSGPAESVHVDVSGVIVRVHNAQISLNAFFNALGYYHAVVVKEHLPDAVYQAVDQDPRYRAAAAALFPASVGPFGFHTLPPCRLVDTRDPLLSGPSALQAGGYAAFSIAVRCGVPETAQAVSVNLTVTQPTSAGDLRVYPADTSVPLVSSINYSPAQTRANNAIVSLNALGRIGVFVEQTLGTAHVIVDVNGYFE
jgi:hypothetical protein